MADYLNQQRFRNIMGLNKPEPVTSAISTGLNYLKQPLDKYAINQNIPVVGGMSAADFLGLTGTQGLLQDFSEGKNITGDMRMFDAMGLLPVAAPAVKVAGKASKALGTEALRQMNEGSGLLGRLTIDPKANILPPEKYRGETLKNMPTKIDVGGRIEEFGTDQRIVDTAKQYAEDMGLKYNPLQEYVQVNPERAKKIAEAFEKMKNNPADPKVKKAYDALINETMAQYEAARKSGIKFEFMPEGVDLYGNPRNAINDLVTNRRMYVFPTEEGFGSINKASETNPLLQKTGEYWNGKPVTANDMFRAVHDVFGHAKHGVGFRATGEENAFQSHARMFSPEALPALATETRGQNSWVNFGKFGSQNQIANPSKTIYADQKIGILPEFVWLEGLLK